MSLTGHRYIKILSITLKRLNYSILSGMNWLRVAAQLMKAVRRWAQHLFNTCLINHLQLSLTCDGAVDLSAVLQLDGNSLMAELHQKPVGIVEEDEHYVWVQPGNEPKTSLKLATSCIAFTCKTKPPLEWDDLMKTRWNPPELTAITKINTGLALCSCYYTFRLRLFRSLSSSLTEAGPTSLLTSTNQSTFKNRRCMQLIPTTEHELTLQV